MRTLMSYTWVLAVVLAMVVGGCTDTVPRTPAVIAPAVILTHPANGAEDVAINSLITATFNKVMNASTLTTATFVVMQGTTPVAGAVTYAGLTATFTPASPLTAGTVYTATITTGVRDLTAHTLIGNYVWTFTTGFTPIAQYTLTVAATHGSVTKLPDQPLYDAGSVVTLAAIPATGYHFTGWSGDVSGATNPIPVTMTGNMSVTANFAPNPPSTYTLTVIAVNGNVAKSPDQATYPAGSVVSLTALPAAGYHFFGWTGDLNSAINPAQITMTADRVVTATFVPNTYTLTLNAVHGTVTKSPDSTNYLVGSVVTLTAVPATGYHFTGWSGDVSGATNPALITMNGNKTVTANFALDPPNTYTLTVIAVHGSVTKSPAQATYDAGSIVMLTALPAAGYHFTGWSGDANGGANAVLITMNSDKVVTASFALNPPNTYTLTVIAVNGSVSRTPDQAAYDAGSVVTLTATPATGYHFSNWSGDVNVAMNPVHVTMNGNRNVTANFALTTVTIAPKTTTVALSTTRQFTASVDDPTNGNIIWSVVENNGGTVSAAGLYTAPATAGIYHVKATSAADATVSDTATVTVPIAVTINPKTTTIDVSATRQFTASVNGSPNTNVTWTVVDIGGGSVSATGLYHAPTTAGIYHVRATSVADATVWDTATVTVQSGTSIITVQ